MTKQEIALELTKLVLEKTRNRAHPDDTIATATNMTKLAVETYNTIVSQIKE